MGYTRCQLDESEALYPHIRHSAYVLVVIVVPWSFSPLSRILAYLPQLHFPRHKILTSLFFGWASAYFGNLINFSALTLTVAFHEYVVHKSHIPDLIVILSVPAHM